MKHLLLLATLLFLYPAWTQQMEFLFKGQVENQDIGKKEGGVVISMVQGGKTISSATSASNGKYTLKGSANYSQPFEVVFAKAGMVTKKVRFNLANLNEEDVPAGLEYRPVEALDLSLFKERENIDFSFLDSQPVAEFTWNERRLAPTPDLVTAKKISQKIEKMLIDAEKNKAEAEANYQAAIQAANGFYDSQSYPEALDKYEEALGYKPDDKYASDRVVELDALINAQKDQELAEGQARQEYDNLIAAADNLKKQGQLENALSKYNDAITKKSDEQYPKDQVAEITALIAAKKKETENQEQYDAAIQLGNTFLKQKSIRAAKEKYEEALELKPSEQYPKDKLAEIEKMMSDLEEKEALKKKYDSALEAADALYDVQDFESAKEKYEEALSIESASTYAKGRVKLCDEAINSAKEETERLAKIEALLKEGVLSLTGKKYDEAKGKYNQVLGLDAENTIAKEKLSEIDRLIEEESNAADQKELQDKIEALLEEGNTLLEKSEFVSAKSKFEEILGLDAENATAKVKISEIEKRIQEESAAAANKELQDKISGLLEEGNTLLDKDELAASKVKFEEVLALEANNNSAKTKIAELETKMAAAEQLAQKEEAFNKLITEGDQAEAGGDLNTALQKYQQANTINTTPEVDAKIAAVQTKIEEGKALADKKIKYDALISEATGLMSAKNLTAAKSKFEEAAAIDPSQALPAQKIAEIDALISNQEANAAKEKEYNKLIEEAKSEFEKGNLAAAKTKYESASGIDDTKELPKQRIQEIETLLKDQADAAEKEKQIANLLADGNNLLSNNDLDGAKNKFQEVIGLDPSNGVANAKLDEINTQLASLKNENEKEEAFKQLVNDGDILFESKDLQAAKQKYQEALTLKPTETSVSDKLASVKAAIDQENELAGEQKKFDALMNKAGMAESAGDFPTAIQEYKKATALKPTETLPKQKIEELEAKIQGDLAVQEAVEQKYNDALSKAQNEEQSGNFESAITAYKEASTIKPAETLPRSKVTELENRLKQASEIEGAIEKKYADAIYAAESEENSGNLKAALAQYKKAASAKPLEPLPKTKITELEKKIQDEIAGQADLNTKYNEAMDRGKELLKQGGYLKAIEEFNKALALKPLEQEPVDLAAEARREEEKLDEGEAQYTKILTVAEKKIESGDFTKAEELIERAKSIRPGDLKQQELLNRIASLKKVQEDYDNAMAKGEELAQAKQYKDAIDSFRKARQIKVTESLPSDRIDEMKRLIKEVSSGDQKEQLYTDFMKKGSSTFGASRYEEALSNYQSALSAKPDDTAAQNKIDEIQQILDDLANQNEAELERKAKFDKLIAEAEELFANEQYVPGAKQKYDEALTIIPTSKYAKSQSERCTELSITKVSNTVKKEYQKLIKVADKKFAKEDFTKAKELYTRAVKFRPSDQYPKNKLAEIERLLNPVVAEFVELEDLGDPFDGSILDGAALLNEDAAKRKASKQQRIQRRQDKIKNAESDMTAQKTQERQEVINDIYEVQRSAQRESESLDDGRQDIIDALRESEDKRDESGRQNNSFEKSENLATQSTLNTIREEVAIDYGIDQGVYEDNSKILRSYSEALEDDMSNRSGNYMDLNHSTDKELEQIQIAVEEDIRSDYVEHLDLEKEVVRILDVAQDKQSSLGIDQYQDALDQKKIVDGVIKNVDQKSTEDAKASGVNNETVKEIQSAIVIESSEQSSQETAHLYKTDAEISNVKERVISDNQDSEKLSENAQITLNEIKDKREDTQYIAYNQEMEKYLANKEILTEEGRKRKGILDKEKKAQGEKIAYVEAMDQKAVSSTSQAQMKDADEHQNAKKSISNVSLSIGETTSEEAQKHEDNVQTLSDVSKTVKKEEQNDALDQKDKAYASQAALNKVDDKPKTKKKTANALGEEYPEGVSQESFTRKDENGLSTAIITRRVVVVNGHADVYTRTQTVNGITYSKNGRPSLSHVWSKETQGPDLVRHY